MRLTIGSIETLSDALFVLTCDAGDPLWRYGQIVSVTLAKDPLPEIIGVDLANKVFKVDGAWAEYLLPFSREAEDLDLPRHRGWEMIHSLGHERGAMDGHAAWIFRH